MAITRAEKTLYICHANERFVYGQTQYRSRSRFLEEIPPHLLAGQPKKEERTFTKKPEKKTSVENFNPLRSKAEKVDANLPYSVNERVSHKKFGLGIVRAINDKTVEVEFTVGKKKFLTAAIDKFIQKM